MYNNQLTFLLGEPCPAPEVLDELLPPDDGVLAGDVERLPGPGCC